MPKRVDWYYHRNGCQTCRRAQDFLTAAGFAVGQQADARKDRVGGAKALELARSASEIWVAKGKRIIHFDMRKAPPAEEELAAAVIGPTGHLRAPTIRRGKTLFIGFHPDLFAEHFG